MLQIEFVIFAIALLYSFIICLFNQFNKLEFRELVLEKSRQSIDKIYKEIVSSSKDINTEINSKHFWNEDIPNSIHKEIPSINSEIIDKIGHDFKYIPSMTELYYSSKGNQNSDRQYVDEHMDGPFFPCNLYRCLIIINGNKNIDTYFPDYNKVINLKKYDAVLFDYNKESHYIDINKADHDDSQRIIIKLHYVKKSDTDLCEKYHCEYGRETRDLFEVNKENLYMSGVVARLSLFYYTNRKYILIVILLLLVLYIKFNKGLLHTIVKALLYLFSSIELANVIYILHFHFLNRKVCKMEN
jgi:hypothetical protein